MTSELISRVLHNLQQKAPSEGLSTASLSSLMNNITKDSPSSSVPSSPGGSDPLPDAIKSPPSFNTTPTITAITTPTDTIPAKSTPQKRQQVSKACSNCRKLHAGCDTERPCHRCVQNGLEKTCVDIPRKIRASKRAKTNSEEILNTEGLPNSSGSLQTTLANLNSTEMDPFFELFATMTPNTPEMRPFPVMDSMALQTYPLPEVETNAPSDQSTSNSSFTPELSYLVQQISELRESNKKLENKLIGVTHKLLQMKNTPREEPPSSPMNAKQSGWHTFGQQSDLAISLWKSFPSQQQSDQCPRNILVECNDTFVQLLGYSVDVLKNNFPCTSMVRKRDICPEARDNKAGREWPKRTQIITAYGLKDVSISITPVLDSKQSLPRYFLVYMMEVAKM